MWIYLVAMLLLIAALIVGGCYALLFWAISDDDEVGSEASLVGHPLAALSPQACWSLLRRWLGPGPLLLTSRRDARGRFRRYRR